MNLSIKEKMMVGLSPVMQCEFSNVVLTTCNLNDNLRKSDNCHLFRYYDFHVNLLFID